MPKNVKTNVSVTVLNRIRETASEAYKSAVPIATADADVIKEIGKIIIDSPNIQNEFVNWLINRIGKVIITSKLFDNPLKMFVKGTTEFGSVIEDVFVDLCRPYQYSEDRAEREVYKRVKPNIKASFYVVNSELMYKQTINDKMLRRAFLSLDGVENLVSKITQAMYTSANYDEFVMIKYLLAKSILDGTVNISDVDAITDETTGKSAMRAFKEASNNFEILSKDYNIMGVYNSADKASQYLLTTNAVDALMGVDVLAYMFGPQFADNGAKIVRVDSFSNFDIERLKQLLKDDSDDDYDEFVPFTDEQLAELAKVQAVLLDENFFQIWYSLIDTGELYNPEGLYYNVWLHAHKTFARSPFANITVFADGIDVPVTTEENT